MAVKYPWIWLLQPIYTVLLKLNCALTAFIAVCWPCLGLPELIGLFCVDVCRSLSESSTSFRVLCDKTQSREAAEVGKQTSNKERLKWKKKQQHERDGKSGLPPTTAGWSIKDNHWQHTGSHKKFKPPSLPSVSSDLIISNQHEKQLQLIWWIIKQSRKELGEGENSKVEVVISLDPNDYVCFAIYQFLTYSVKYHLSSFSYLPSGDRNMAKKKKIRAGI